MPNETIISRAKIIIEAQGADKTSKEFKALEESVNDAVDEISVGLKGIPDKATKEFAGLRRQFSELKKTFASKDVTTSVTGALGLEKLRTDVNEISKNQLQQLDTSLKRIQNTSLDAGRDISSTATALETLQLQSAAASRKFFEVSDGIKLAFGGQGIARITGVREAVNGLVGGNTKLANGLRVVETLFSNANQAQTAYSKQAVRIAETAAANTTAIQQQIIAIRGSTKSTATQSAQLTELQRKSRQVNDQFTTLFASIQSGSKVSVQQVAKLIATSSQLQKEFAVAKGTIFDPGSAAGKALGSLDKQMSSITDSARSLLNRVKEDNTEMRALGISGVKTGKAFGFFSKADKEIKQVNTALHGTTSAAKLATGAITPLQRVLIGALGGFAGGLAASGVHGIGQTISMLVREIPRQLVGLASRAEESLSKFNIVFKESAVGVSNDLELLASSIGRSALELKESAAAFQDTFVPLGFGREQAADLSTQLVALTADIASFNNKLDADVARDFQSALVGNTETVRKYGIVITQSTLDTELLALGIKGGVKQASEAEKAFARASLIIKGSGDAIGDASRTSQSWANQLRALRGFMTDLGVTLGQQVLPAIAPFLQILNQVLTTIGPQFSIAFGQFSQQLLAFATRVSETFTSVLNGVVNLEDNLSTSFAFIISIMRGDWGQAWDFFLLTIDNALQSAFEYLVYFVDNAFDWGVSFVTQIANGIIEAASSILIEAVNYVGEIIASFMQPGSPPEQGPLSTIDKWGLGLADTFLSSMRDADLSPVKDILSSVGDILREGLGKKGLGVFQEVRKDYLGLIESAKLTGEINEETFDKIADNIRKSGQAGSEAVIAQLKAQLELQKQDKKIADIKNEIAEAEAKGFIPAELKAKLAAAEEERSIAEDQIDLQQQLQEIAELDQKFFDDKSKDKLASIGAIGAAAGAAAKKEVLSYAQAYEKELSLLNQKLSLGLISEEDYAKERLKLEEKYVDSALEAGETVSQDRLDKIAELKKQVEDFKETGKSAGETIKEGIADSLFDGLGKVFDPSTISTTGQSIGTALINGFQTSVGTSLARAKSNILTSFQNLVTSIGGAMTSSGLLGTLIRDEDFQNSVRQFLVNLPTTLNTIVTNISTFFKDSWPTILASLNYWASQFWTWVDGALSQAGTALAAILGTIAIWVRDPGTQRNLLDLGNELGLALADGLVFLAENSNKLTEVMSKILLGLGAVVAGSLVLIAAIGGQILAGILAGLLEKIGIDLEPATLGELSKILKDIGNNIVIIASYIGKSIVTGIVNGWNSLKLWAAQSILDLIDAAINGVKSFLGIASPSTVFAGIGLNIIQGLIKGIQDAAGGVVTALSGIFGNLFGSGSEKESDQFNSIILGSNEMTASLTTAFNTIGLLWKTTIIGMTTLFTEFMTNTVLVLSLFNAETFPLILENLRLSWNLFLFNFQNMWKMAIDNLTTIFVTFANLVISLLQQIINKLQELIDKLGEVGDAIKELGEIATSAFEEMTEGIEDAASAIENKLIPAIDEAIKRLERLEDRANSARNAINSITGSDRASVEGSAATGAWETTDGMWRLHDGEMVLPRRIAEKMRGLFSSFGGIDLNGFGKLPSFPLSNGVSLSNLNNLVPAIANGGMVTQNFYQSFQNESDMNKFNKRVVRATTDALSIGQ